MRSHQFSQSALEFATRNMYNRAHSLGGSGYKTNAPVTDFMVTTALSLSPSMNIAQSTYYFKVMHLSGIEHEFVRRFGFEKGIALINLTSTRVLKEVRP